MLNTYTITPQTLITDEEIKFDVNSILTGCTTTHVVETGVINLNKPGFYFITFNGVVTTEEIEPVEVTMYKGSQAVPGAVASANNTSGDIPYFSLSFSTIVRVKPCCCKQPTQITFKNSGVNATYDNVNVVVTKLC